MKNQTHTPGPWKVAGSCHVHESTDGLFYHVAHVTVADDYAPNPSIADVSCRGRYCSKIGANTAGPEQAANARLIASAPMLLDALNAIVHTINCHNIPVASYLKRDFATAQSAIAAAQGEREAA